MSHESAHQEGAGVLFVTGRYEEITRAHVGVRGEALLPPPPSDTGVSLLP